MYEAVLGPGKETILFAGFTALVYFFGALVAAFLVDRVGRRPLFMYGSGFMTIWLVLMAVFNKVSLGLTSAILVITFTMVYVCTFGMTWACVDWLCKLQHILTRLANSYITIMLIITIDPAEIFPFRTRAKGMSLAVSSNWVRRYIR